MTEIEELARRKVEDLIAVGLYQARANKVKEYIMTLYKRCEKYLKPIEDVREILAREIGERSLSQEVIELRRRETH
jgi:ABC-type nitrate/sulfonate/bicarbonate transport system substrate-binding protein